MNPNYNYNNTNEYNYSPPSRSNTYSSSNYGAPSNQYGGAPSNQYGGAPSNQYGSPQNNFPSPPRSNTFSANEHGSPSRPPPRVRQHSAAQQGGPKVNVSVRPKAPQFADPLEKHINQMLAPFYPNTTPSACPTFMFQTDKANVENLKQTFGNQIDLTEY